MEVREAEKVTLHEGHAWLLRWLFEQFRTAEFTFDPDTSSFEGAGKGYRIEEAAGTGRYAVWLSDLVAAGALTLTNSEGAQGGEMPRWVVAALPVSKGSEVVVVQDLVTQELVDDLLELIPASRIEGTAVVLLKGGGHLPPEYAERLRKGLIRLGARQDVLIIQVPQEQSLHFLSEKKMRDAGWVRKPRLWSPGET